jgi:hypothetical protein
LLVLGLTGRRLSISGGYGLEAVCLFESQAVPCLGGEGFEPSISSTYSPYLSRVIKLKIVTLTSPPPQT